jgi:hypothetical protein
MTLKHRKLIFCGILIESKISQPLHLLCDRVEPRKPNCPSSKALVERGILVPFPLQVKAVLEIYLLSVLLTF